MQDIIVNKPSTVFSLLSISDIHTGHPKTTTSFIIDNLKNYFFNEIKTNKIKLIIIGGDFFDRALQLRDPNVFLISMFIHDLLKLCQRYNVIIRVLEGTPSHDWKQNRLFEHINDSNNINAKLKFITNLSIEYIEELGVNILYVPDECYPSTEEIWSEILKLMHEKKINEVDISVVHGLFDFKTPSIVKNVHNSESFSNITKYIVLGAHDHRHASKGKILINGSFDRLAHGEEENKGFWKVTIDTINSKINSSFIINRNSKIYKTIKCSGLSMEKTIEKIESQLDVPAFSYIKIECLKEDLIASQLDFLKKKYPFVEWSIDKKNKENKIEESKVLEVNKQIEQIFINKENIVNLLMNRIKNKFKDNDINRIENKLMEFIY